MLRMSRASRSVVDEFESSGRLSPEAAELSSAREADGPKRGIAAELKSRWQIPLLVLSLALLGLGIWRLRPQAKPPSFESLRDQARLLVKAEAYEEASKHVETMLGDPQWSPEQKRQLHRLMADAIFQYESRNAVHGPGNCRRILKHLDAALAPGETTDAITHYRRALTREWLNQPAEAVAEYRQALTLGIDKPWDIRQRVIQLRRMVGDLQGTEFQQELEAFLATSDAPVALQFWAAERQLELLNEQSKHAEAEQFLADHAALFAHSTWRQPYDYLRALVWHHLGRDEDAERLLRELRDQLVPGDPLYARTGWLLGRILQQQGAPEYALAFFNEVIDKTVPSPSRTACFLGRAETLAELQRHDEALPTYEQTIKLAADDPPASLIDLKQVRESATGWYQTLVAAGDAADARAYLKIGARLAPPIDQQLQTNYSKRLADLGVVLGREKARAAEQATGKQREVLADEAQRYLADAGQEYLRLARLSVLDEAASAAALWDSADAFDLAGERPRLIGVLETFVREHAGHPRVPEAILQLGRVHQLAGQIDQAVAWYQRNLIEFPRTPAALASLIPLADCFQEQGKADLAEQTLMRIVMPAPGETLAVITPEAEEYRDALFRLGDLYIRSEQYEKAITRYEEALERYADDPRADQATFQLADAYRKSAARILQDLADGRNVTQKDNLRLMYLNRLQRAGELFQRVIARYEHRPADRLSDIDRLYAKLSHLYAADAVYDLSQVADPPSMEPYARALEMYEKAAWSFQHDPIAMSAYVQVINCYLRMGKVSQAWMALQRARWALRNIPTEQFQLTSPEMDYAYWDSFLTWLEGKPTFASMASAQAGSQG